MTHILITSGGTTVPIDPVRKISNSSSGRFGCGLATAALQADLDVTFLASRQSLSPFSLTFDLHSAPDFESNLETLKKAYAFRAKTHGQYYEYRYDHFNEYAQQLEKLIRESKPEIIILAAAVSDYLVGNVSENKIRSSDQLQLQLTTAPKLIHEIRAWSPDSYIVGCKLLVNASEEELIAAANKSIAQHDLDLCIANDLASVKRGEHEVILVARDGSTLAVKHDLGTTVIAECLKRSKK